MRYRIANGAALSAWTDSTGHGNGTEPLSAKTPAM